jgi:hypothetical protein
MQLHRRANWSPREDRRITLLWLGLFLIIVVVGFGLNLTHYLHESPPVPKVVHVHAIITTIWLLILTMQVVLVEVDNVKLHRKLGWFAGGWAIVLIFFAAVGELSWQAANLHTPSTTPAFLSIPFGNLLCFAVLITWGFLLRKNIAAHRRVIMLANLAISVAGFRRLVETVFHHPNSPIENYFFFYSGTLFIVLLMFLWDWKNNHVMMQFVIGAAFMVTIEILSFALFYNAAWKTFATGVLEAWGKFAL